MDFIAIRDYARRLAGTMATSGWRPFWGWGGGLFTLQLLHFAFIDVPSRHLAVPDGFYMGVLGFVSLYVTTFIARGVQNHMDLRVNRESAGGVINPHGGPFEPDGATA